MLVDINHAFSQNADVRRLKSGGLRPVKPAQDLPSLKAFLDLVHIRECLLRPFLELPDYPVVESRDLMPSFDVDPFEHKELPGFSMVVLDRQLRYFEEIFQFDILHSPKCCCDEARGQAAAVREANVTAFCQRLPRASHESFKHAFSGADFTCLEMYPLVTPALLNLDRAHVLSLNADGQFHLSGIYASLPCHLDAELKRFGLSIGKFKVGDDELYEKNRHFVYQFLMETHGFPIVSERRTSAALFARRLHKMGERYMVRVLGQSDRVVTTLSHDPEAKDHPHVEKLALVSINESLTDAIAGMREGGYFVDEARRVVILRAHYQQHDYDRNNVREDRALSLSRQEIVHPLTGKSTSQFNVLKEPQVLFIRLNDIVRGEYMGRTVYRRTEVVEKTDTHEKRLKFLHTWLAKHQRRIIAYSEEFYANVAKVLDGYLLSPDNAESFEAHRALYHEVWNKYSYIQQARKVKRLEDLMRRRFRGEKLKTSKALRIFADVLAELKFELVSYFDSLVERVLAIGESMLSDPYLRRKYVAARDEELSPQGLAVKKAYGRIVSLLDEFRSIRRLRSEKRLVTFEETETI